MVKDLAWKKQPLAGAGLLKDLFPPCDTCLGLLKATHLRDIGQCCQFRQRSEPLVLFVNYGNSRPFVSLWSLVQTSGPLNPDHPLQFSQLQNHHLKISGCNDSTFRFYRRLSDQNSTKVQYTKQSQSGFITFHRLKKIYAWSGFKELQTLKTLLTDAEDVPMNVVCQQPWIKD